VNSSYAQRFGLNPSDVVGRESADLLGEEVFAQLKPHADAARRGQRTELDADVDCRRLGIQHLQCSFDPEIDTAGQVVGYVSAIFDITERQRAGSTNASSIPMLGIGTYHLRVQLSAQGVKLSLGEECVEDFVCDASEAVARTRKTGRDTGDSEDE
jgi:PAS domain S-box-containing protein